MAFLDRIFRNRGLVENLSRDPVARIEPIAPPIRPPRPPFPIPQAPVLPIEPLPIEEPRLPFERPPLRLPRDDFFSVQRLDNIPEIETITPPVIPPQPRFIQELRPPLVPPPLEDFGFGPGIRPTEIRDEQGNIIVGSAGVTPPVVPPVITESVITPDPIIEPVVTPDPVTSPKTKARPPVVAGRTLLILSQPNVSPLKYSKFPISVLNLSVPGCGFCGLSFVVPEGGTIK